MPLHHYGVLKGRVVRRVIDRDPVSPHYHILVEAGTMFHVAINVWSTIDHSPLLHLIDQEFEHPLSERWLQLSSGFTELPSLPQSGAIDYVRGQLLNRARIRIAPNEHRGEGGLADLLDLYVNRAIANPEVNLYAFGTRWGPNPRETDRTFRGSPIHPSDGIHDIHMNQGNPDRPGNRDDQHFKENGPWQDGALFLHFPEVDQWIGVFLAFRSQTWQTDSRTGKPVESAGKDNGKGHRDRIEQGGSIRIVAAMVNPVGPAPEVETVTLINTTGESVALRGWTVVNTEQQATQLRGVIEPRQSRVFRIDHAAPLGNQGGTILLLDDQGWKIDGVAYTRGQAAREGRMLTF